MVKVVIHFDEHGEISYFVSGAEAAVYVVDERAPGDRVFELLSRVDPTLIYGIIGDDEIGSMNDVRGPAITHKITAVMAGEKHLRGV